MGSREDMGASLRDRAGRAIAPSLLRVSAIAATIACASCTVGPKPTGEQWRDTFNSCVFTLTGLFHPATPDIIAECKRQADEATKQQGQRQ